MHSLFATDELAQKLSSVPTFREMLRRLILDETHAEAIVLRGRQTARESRITLIMTELRPRSVCF